MDFFDINNIAFQILGYDLSYIELIGTIFGLICVYLASLPNILTWPASIINQIAFFVLFFQVQLYADMFLQIYFLVIAIYGWYYWSKPTVEKKISYLSAKSKVNYGIILLVGTIGLGILMKNIDTLFPSLFEKPAAFPFADAFTTTASIIASILLARKQIENWILWIAVDIVSVVIYWKKGIQLVSIEYFVFLLICIFGYFNWKREITN